MFTEMSFEQIKPHVRSMQHVYAEKAFRPVLFNSYSQRIYFITSGSCTFVADGITYPMKKHSLILIRNNVVFELIPNKTDTHLISCAFSYSPYNPEWKIFPDAPRAEHFIEDRPREKVIFTDHTYLNDTICIHNMVCAKQYISDCLSEFRLGKMYCDEICDSHLKAVLHMVARNYEMHGNAASTREKKENYIDAIIEFIHNNYQNDINNSVIGKTFNLHPYYINKLMLERLNCTLHRYVNSVRIENAVRLLTSTDMSISEISEAVGFNDSNYFSKYFKQIMGQSPSYYHNR